MSAYINVYRGEYVESQHAFDFIIYKENEIIAQSGNIEQPIFPRSCIKLLQALDFVESGAFAASKSNNKELCLACASHNSEEIHVDLVRAWLKKNNLTEEDLACGPSQPLQNEDLIHWAKSGKSLSPAYNNCSGKHTALLLTAKHLSIDIKQYHLHDKEIQQRFLQKLEELCNEKFENPTFAIDGCGLPNYRMSLKQIAKAMLKFGVQENTNPAVKSIFSAISEHPYLLAGKNRLCSELIDLSKGRIIAKDGAEGVFCAYIRDKKISIAMKIKDGSYRAFEVAMANLLKHYGFLQDAEQKALKHWLTKDVYNSRSVKVGYIRAEIDES